jgi:hypothetical protein
MGLEATCAATLDGEASRGKALLETTELLFRGGFRARVPLSEVKTATVSGRTLTVKWRGGTLALDLGADAAKWAEKIKTPPSRLDKLGVKPGTRVALLDVADTFAAFSEELARAGAALAARGPVDIFFYAPMKSADLNRDRVVALAKRLAPAGAMWIVRPKGKDTPVTEAATRHAGLAAGLVDVKVAAFSPTHTALKFVRRLRDRG